jgi:hypothetical protein
MTIFMANMIIFPNSLVGAGITHSRLLFLFVFSFIPIIQFLLNVSVLTLHSYILQIYYHFSTFFVTDMTIEKLRKVATTHVDASFKAKWLRWWNSHIEVKMENKFLSTLLLREKYLDDWLNKVFFWAHVYLQVLFFPFVFLFFAISNCWYLFT